MGSACISGLMDATMKGNTLRIIDRVQVCSRGLTVASTLALGKRVKCMEKALTGTPVGLRPRECGLRDKGH